MAITLTPRLGLYQWGQGSDPPGRIQFNSILTNIDGAAAVDDGTAGAAALPTTGVNGQPLSDGRYAQTINSGQRQLYRRAGGAWAQVGGNAWAEAQYESAGAGLPVGGIARQRTHASLASPSAVYYWDGSSIHGGRQAVGDLNASTPGAVHVGDTTSAVDLANKGRVYARTTADTQRAFVASAHGAGAGNLYSAIEPGGGVPWLIDSIGRMRSQAPTAFGGVPLAANVPMSVAPGVNDLVGMDVFADTAKPAQRWWRAQGDTTPIAMVEQTKITLGRATWAGGVLALLAPTIGLTGATTITGALGVTGDTTLAKATLSGALAVAGATTLAGLTTSAAAQLASAAVIAGLTVGGAASITGDLTLSNRFRLPTSSPSGSAAGQVRVSSDWVPEVYDGAKWRGRFGASTSWKHAWTASAVTVSGADVYQQITSGWSVAQAGSLATLSGGDFTLGKAGLWCITAGLFIDSPNDGINRLQIRWPDGAFLGRTVMTDCRIRQSSGMNGIGQGECFITWVGYVPDAAAANELEFWVACKNGTSNTNNSATAFYFTAEYLSA